MNDKLNNILADPKNCVIIFLSVVCLMFAISHYTADYTMTQEQANITAKQAQKPITIYLENGVQEDDIYIQPSEIGKVDIKPMPIPNKN